MSTTDILYRYDMDLRRVASSYQRSNFLTAEDIYQNCCIFLLEFAENLDETEVVSGRYDHLLRMYLRHRVVDLTRRDKHRRKNDFGADYLKPELALRSPEEQVAIAQDIPKFVARLKSELDEEAQHLLEHVLDPVYVDISRPVEAWRRALGWSRNKIKSVLSRLYEAAWSIASEMDLDTNLNSHAYI